MSTSSISPTERRALRELQARLDGIAESAVAGCRVSVEDTACGAASVAIGRLLEALEATEAMLDEHRRANDQIMGQNAAMSAEITALKKGARSLMESRKKWRRQVACYRIWRKRALRAEAGCDRYGAALEEIAWPPDHFRPADLQRIAKRALHPNLPASLAGGVTFEEFSRRLAEGRADDFTRTEEPR